MTSPLTRTMALRDLSKPAWSAALEAARVLRSCNPNVADDRVRYRAAREGLARMLPAGVDERDIITQAVRWEALDSFAVAFAGEGHLITIAGEAA